jgi:hypothetical protein
MKLSLALLLLSVVFASNAFAKDDRRECKAELAKLQAAFSTNYTSQNHHGYRRAKDAENDGDYKKCVDQAKKARERAERAGDLGTLTVERPERLA